MALRIVLDTNIIVSGFVYPGSERALIELATQGRFELAASEYLLAEVQRVLLYKFDWSYSRMESRLTPLTRIALIVNPPRLVTAVPHDHPDNRILDCAVNSGAEYLVTGDRKHLLPLGEFEGVKILRAPDVLKLFQ